MSSLDRLQRQRKGLYRSNAIDVLCVLVLIAYFLHFAVPSLAGGFNDDEMMNIYAYWRLGALKSLWANICFWKGIVRPIGRPARTKSFRPAGIPIMPHIHHIVRPERR